MTCIHFLLCSSLLHSGAGRVVRVFAVLAKSSSVCFSSSRINWFLTLLVPCIDQV
jgi:hypothetical protein